MDKIRLGLDTTAPHRRQIVTKKEKRISKGFPESLFPIREKDDIVLNASSRYIDVDATHPQCKLFAAIPLCYLEEGQILNFEGYQANFGATDLSGRQIKIVDRFPGTPIHRAWLQVELQFGDQIGNQ